MVSHWRFLVRLVPVALIPVLSGCVAVAAGGAVAGISAARQERTIGHALDDTVIKATLDGRLAEEKLYFHTSTTVVEGRVLLAGRVDTPEARLDATRIAWGVNGVRKVDNDIEVSDFSGWLDGPSDLIMRTQLATILLADKSIHDVNYTTDVVHGVVYLMGVAQDQGEMDRVIAHAEKLNGAKRVENYVVLKDDPIRPGNETAADSNSESK
ncbi:MAG TPA: BON domain-containing protein [Micropepsaceae bacterium]|jgi:osmotically-inducible protein OsmY|nr:BON domain-containing protein [Micropepsaceae bacterium]